MGDVQISRFTIPVELLFFSWLEIRNKTGLACSKELPPGTPKPQVLNSTQLPPLSGYDKIHFLGWCSKHNTKRMCTQSLAFWLHPYKNWKSVTVFLKPLSVNYLTFYFFPACFWAPTSPRHTITRPYLTPKRISCAWRRFSIWGREAEILSYSQPDTNCWLVMK